MYESIYLSKNYATKTLFILSEKLFLKKYCFYLVLFSPKNQNQNKNIYNLNFKDKFVVTLIFNPILHQILDLGYDLIL
jgi:hypothetical protein